MTGSIGRRRILGSLALPLLTGCAAPFQPIAAPATTPHAQALLDASAAAHGYAALPAIHDVSVSYAGAFHGLVGSLQPDLVDAGFRGSSEERLLLRDRLVAQAHTGPQGRKQVVRHSPTGGHGSVRVWFNGQTSDDANKLAAAALVVDCYSLFLLGPMLLAGNWSADRSLVMAVAGAERVGDADCDVLRVRLTPGLGLSDGDDLALFIGRGDRLMRRVRFSLNGLESTRGAVAEVDMRDHIAMAGLRWPTRFHEGLLRPLPIAVHDWRMTGLDLNRGLEAADVSGAAFTGEAAAPATALPQPTGAL